MNLDLGNPTFDALWKLGVMLALAFGLKDILASMLRKAAAGVLAYVKGTPTKLDDGPGAVLAGLLVMGSEAAEKGDLEKVRQVIATAAALPPPKGLPSTTRPTR